MSTEEFPAKMEISEPAQESTSAGNTGNENFVVLDTAGELEDSEKDDKSWKETKDRSGRNAESDSGKKVSSESVSATTKPASTNQKLRKKPKAPVVDVNSLRKRKWQLKVYPLHAEDLQLSYMSILCKLASESLLYIPSEGRHGKAELYVATQKETAAIIRKLLRMEFHHPLLSIEVVRKDTGGKEDGNESKKECKAFLMFDKFLTMKIFDAKREKGTIIEKTVTLNRLPKSATKDFIGALFPFSTEIEIIESDDPEERKALVICKTPVTALLVYKAFKRLEINDVHVKLTVDESVKAISLPAIFFMPPPEKKDSGPVDSLRMMNQSSLPPRRPTMTPLNRRVLQIKKRAMMNRKRPTRGQLMQGQRPGQGVDYPPGPGYRRMMEHPGDRHNRHDSRERNVTKEMLQLQNQLNQAIKNQIAMLNTSQPGGSGMHHDSYSMGGGGGGAPHRPPLLGHRSRHYGGADMVGGPPSSGRNPDHHHQPDFGGISWTADRSGRLDRGDRNENFRPDRMGRPGVGRMDRVNRQDNKRMDMGGVHVDDRSAGQDRNSRDRGGDRRSSGGETSRRIQGGQRQPHAFGGNSSGDAGRGKRDRSSMGTPHGAEKSGTHMRRSSEFAETSRASQRSEKSYSSNSHNQPRGEPNRYGDYGHAEGDNNSYYRHF